MSPPSKSPDGTSSPLLGRYATLDGSVTSIDFNEFSKMMSDLKLGSNKYKHAKPRDLDRTFIAINASSVITLKAQAAEAKDKSKAVAQVCLSSHLPSFSLIC